VFSSSAKSLVLLAALLLASWIGWKFIQGRRFLKRLAVARIKPAELQ